MHTELTQELVSENGSARLRIPLPFGEKGDVSLKKAGAELIVAVGPRKRTIILPAGLARRRPTAARLADGSLEVSFEDSADGSDEPARTPAAVR
jgi:arsenite-transporting ATPase